MAIPVEEYLAHLLTDVGVLGVEEVAVTRAGGRVLAQDLVARLAVPPFDNSAMDGFALRAGDAIEGMVPVVGDVPAGGRLPVPLAAGTAVRIMTGAPVPAGADCVVPVEDTDQPSGPAPLPAAIRVRSAPRPGQHVRRAGDDVAVGDVVIAAGTRLGAAALASAISIGYGHLPCHRRPRVVVVATGSELTAPGAPLGPGMIPDSNSTLIAALAEESHCEVVGVHTVPDDVGELARVLARAAAEADLIVSSGGVSAGAFDVVKELTAAAGFTFAQVAMQPGKPQGHGFVAGPAGRRTPMVTLPGNPVSVFVSFHMFVRPVLAAMEGELATPAYLRARALRGWASPAGRRQVIPVRLTPPESPEDPVPGATPTHRLGSGSHLVASLHRANALAIIPEDTTRVAAGDLVAVTLVGRF